MTETTCRSCGRPLPESAGRGRPLDYCGPTCRRSAELDMRRLHSLLSRAEKAEQMARLRAATVDAWQRGDQQQQAEWWSAEVGRLRAELRGLLGGGRDDGENPVGMGESQEAPPAEGMN